MREIDTIIVHCSDSSWGDAAAIRRWHTDPRPRGRGWRDIGYHFVILNGVRASRGEYNIAGDGVLETGRPVAEAGAHCRGHNARSIGLCLIGKHHFTAKQLFVTLPLLIVNLRAEFPSIRDVRGHRWFNHAKTCPNFNVETMLEALRIG